MADISTQPYKGARDFYPSDMRVQNYIFKVWRTVVERYGYEEYTAPMLELTDLYRAKTGEEIVNEQTYSFTDRGGREVTIRPEMTPSVARMVAAKQQELAYPLRWYSIVNNWRYERPQRGRVREFWQLNVDLLGVSGIEADAEIIRMADSIMRAFGAKDDMFIIRINNRKLTSLLMGEYLDLDVQKSHLLSKLLDRKAKMSESAFDAQAQSIVGEDIAKLNDLLNIKSIDELPANVVESGQVEELRQLFDTLKAAEVNVRFDLTLMRGFDYYTGVVFEVFDTNPENPRAIFGGGRYDELTEIFGATDVPAVGFAPGDVGTANFLETHDLLPKLSSSVKVYMAVISEAVVAEAQKLASALRKAGISVAVDIGGKKAGSQVKKADKDGIPFVVFVGEEEIKAGKFTLRELESGNEAKLEPKELIQHLQ